MLWTIAVVLIMLWMSGLVSGYSADPFIHILLAVAITVMLIQIEDDCSDYGSRRPRKGYMKRQLIRRSKKLLPALARVSGETVLQPAISPQPSREE
jgi:hypothetical protein